MQAFAALKGRSSTKSLTGHTLDDQAETVLLRVIRGAGLRGLAGIHPTLLVEDEDGVVCGEIVRPLLTTRRRDLEQLSAGAGSILAGRRYQPEHEVHTKSRTASAGSVAGKGIQSFGGGDSGGYGGDCARRRGLLG